MSSVTALLGAGFSAAAGLPMANQIFDDESLPPHKSSERSELLEVVRDYKSWLAENPDASVEEWLLSVYDNISFDLFAEPIVNKKWQSALKFLLRRLSENTDADHSPYYYGVSRYQSHPNHTKFWDCLISNGLQSIISLNYDILVERALHTQTDDKKTTPEFTYGGFPHPTYVDKMINKAAPKGQKSVPFKLGSRYQIYKLHGSLNWAFDVHQPNMKCYDDVRAIFRVDDSMGIPAVIPPLPEKNLPPRFATIWNDAKQALKKSNKLIVCGYSLPDYDFEMRRWLAEALKDSTISQLAVLDPNSKKLVGRWKDLVPSKCDIVPLQGIPGSIDSGALQNFLDG